jgi:hypothetical protein
MTKADFCTYLQLLYLNNRRPSVEDILHETKAIVLNDNEKLELIEKWLGPQLTAYATEANSILRLFPLQHEGSVFLVPWRQSRHIVDAFSVLSPAQRDSLRVAITMIQKDKHYNYPQKFSHELKQALPSMYHGNEMQLRHEFVLQADVSPSKQVSVTEFFQILQSSFLSAQLTWWTSLYDIDFDIQKLLTWLKANKPLTQGTDPTDYYINTMVKHRQYLMYRNKTFEFLPFDVFEQEDEVALVCVDLQNHEKMSKQLIQQKLVDKDKQMCKQGQRKKTQEVDFVYELQTQEIPFCLLTKQNICTCIRNIGKAIEEGNHAIPVVDTDYYDYCPKQEICEFDMLQQLLDTLRYI